MFQTSNQLPCVTSSPFHFVSWLNRRQGEAVQSWFNLCDSCQLVQPMVAVTAVYKGPATTVSLGDSYAKSLLLPSISLLGSPCISWSISPFSRHAKPHHCLVFIGEFILNEVYGPVAKYGSRTEIHRGRSASPASRGSNMASRWM